MKFQINKKTGFPRKHMVLDRNELLNVNFELFQMAYPTTSSYNVDTRRRQPNEKTDFTELSWHHDNDGHIFSFRCASALYIHSLALCCELFFFLLSLLKENLQWMEYSGARKFSQRLRMISRIFSSPLARSNPFCLDTMRRNVYQRFYFELNQ